VTMVVIAVYVSFERTLGHMSESILDVHEQVLSEVTISYRLKQSLVQH